MEGDRWARLKPRDRIVPLRKDGSPDIERAGTVVRRDGMEDIWVKCDNGLGFYLFRFPEDFKPLPE
jgi:hypothetical protein